MLSVGASWIIKSLGLVSTIVLARVLIPEDFAALSIVMMIIYFFEIFSMQGGRSYILSLDLVSDVDLNNSYSLNVVSRIAVVMCLIATGGFLLRYLGYEYLYNAMCVSSLGLLISAFENPKLNILRRELKYEGIFIMGVVSKLSSFILTIILALTLKSYWAMIWGSLCYSLINCLMGYYIAPYIPSIDFSKFRPQWEFSKWIYLNSFISYSRAKADSFILAKYYSAQDLGLFTIAKELGVLVYQQIALPINDIVIVSIRKSVNDSSDAAAAIVKYYALVFTVIFPISFFISIFSKPIVLLVLGDKWVFASELLVSLSFLGFVSSIIAYLYAVLNALRKIKERFYYDTTTAFIILIAMFAVAGLDLVYFCVFLVFITAINLIGFMFLVKRFVDLRVFSLFVSGLPSIMSALFTFCFIRYFGGLFDGYKYLFLVDCFLYFSLYALMNYLLLKLFSFNLGSAFVLEQLHDTFKKLRKR